jgi:hypothetical protein
MPTALTAENAEPADVKEAFLLACTTYDYEDRYETLLKNLETATADMTVEKIAAEQKEYYASVSKYVSEKFYQTMCANREILKYEKYANENGYTYRPDGFEFTEYSKNGDKITYSFVVHLIVTNSDGTEKRVTVKGQITVQEKDGEALITSCWPTGFVPIEDFR